MGENDPQSNEAAGAADRDATTSGSRSGRGPAPPEGAPETDAKRHWNTITDPPRA